MVVPETGNLVAVNRNVMEEFIYDYFFRYRLHSGKGQYDYQYHQKDDEYNRSPSPPWQADFFVKRVQFVGGFLSQKGLLHTLEDFNGAFEFQPRRSIITGRMVEHG